MRSYAAVAATLALCACTTPPPASQLPNAQAAIDRMRATTACGNGVQADAKLDHFSSEGRIRTELLMIAERPARLRMDILVTGAGSVATLTTDGTRFEATDKRENRFLYGPATACNIARITRIPIPGFVLVTLLRVQSPVLKHDAPGLPPPTIAWSGSGYYVVRIPGNNDAVEEIHLAPRPDDWNKPYGEQNLRVLDVTVSQKGVLLYHAELDTHQSAPMSKEASVSAEDALLGMKPLPPSGPMCTAEIPRRIHVEMPNLGADVLFRYEKVEWNPPLQPGVFTQQPQPGLTPVEVKCND